MSYTPKDFSHLNGWSRDKIDNRKPDTVLVGKEARASGTLTSLMSLHTPPGVDVAKVEKKTCHWSRFCDGKVNGRDWEHIRAFDADGTLLGEMAYAT